MRLRATCPDPFIQGVEQLVHRLDQGPGEPGPLSEAGTGRTKPFGQRPDVPCGFRLAISMLLDPPAFLFNLPDAELTGIGRAALRFALLPGGQGVAAPGGWRCRGEGMGCRATLVPVPDPGLRLLGHSPSLPLGCRGLCASLF